MWDNDLTKLLNVKYPIIQAPMAGGVTSSELVAAVSNAGGLGMMAAGYMTPGQIRDQIREIHQLTSKPFGINLFVPTTYSVDSEKIELAKKIMNPIKEMLNIQEEYYTVPTYSDDLERFLEQIQVIIEEKMQICSFTFGLPSNEILDLLKRNFITIIGTATTVEEAIINEKAGMDAIVMQGSEAGGHRGTFNGSINESLIGLLSLIPQTVDHVGIPLIAAGGIMDGRGVMAAKCLGAKGVQMGTAFLTCKESGANQVYKDAILHSTEDQTVLTRVFSGKTARGVKNMFIIEMEKYEQEFPEYPTQNELTKGLRKASVIQKNPEYMSIWSGQSPRLAQSLTVNELMDSIVLGAGGIFKSF